MLRQRSKVLRQRTMCRAFLILVLALVVAQPAAGSVRLYGDSLAVVDDPYGPPRLVDLAGGRVHALYPSGTAFSIGSGFATPTPSRGRARFDARGATLAGRRVPRLRLRSIPVRFRSDGATLAGTLLLPPGSGRKAAVAYVTGSGPTIREYLPELQAILLHNGVAVLAYDKRGDGASGGIYPGESPTEATIDSSRATPRPRRASSPRAPRSTGARRARGAEPGGLDHAARGHARAGDPLPRGASRAPR